MSTPDDALLSGPSAQLLCAIGDLQLAPLHKDATAAMRAIGLIGDMYALARASGLAYSGVHRA